MNAQTIYDNVKLYKTNTQVLCSVIKISDTEFNVIPNTALDYASKYNIVVNTLVESISGLNFANDIKVYVKTKLNEILVDEFNDATKWEVEGNASISNGKASVGVGGQGKIIAKNVSVSDFILECDIEKTGDTGTFYIRFRNNGNYLQFNMDSIFYHTSAPGTFEEWLVGSENTRKFIPVNQKYRLKIIASGGYVELYMKPILDVSYMYVGKLNKDKGLMPIDLGTIAIETNGSTMVTMDNVVVQHLSDFSASLDMITDVSTAKGTELNLKFTQQPDETKLSTGNITLLDDLGGNIPIVITQKDSHNFAIKINEYLNKGKTYTLKFSGITGVLDQQLSNLQIQFSTINNGFLVEKSKVTVSNIDATSKKVSIPVKTLSNTPVNCVFVAGLMDGTENLYKLVAITSCNKVLSPLGEYANVDLTISNIPSNVKNPKIKVFCLDSFEKMIPYFQAEFVTE